MYETCLLLCAAAILVPGPGASTSTAPATVPSQPVQELVFTSGRHGFAFRIDQDWSAAKPVWMWTAACSKEIAGPDRALFKSIDECKPVLGGTHLLITSSSAGGVALIRRADNACVFYAPATNAHSAELVGDRWIAVCSSLGGNELQLFDRHPHSLPARKIAAIPLHSAHGAVYDWREKVLWALGGRE